MGYIIISDDLSGAAAMASLIGPNIPVITINRIEDFPKFSSRIISLDIETRNSTDALEKLNIVMEKFPDFNILARIDTMLRGSTSEFIEFMSLRGKLTITDTIPDYGRYTTNGYTVYKGKKIDLNSVIPNTASSNTMILDSATYDDLKRIARECVENELLPVDPGPLIANYLELIV